MPTSITSSFAFTHPSFTAPGNYTVYVLETTTEAVGSVVVTITAK